MDGAQRGLLSGREAPPGAWRRAAGAPLVQVGSHADVDHWDRPARARLLPERRVSPRSERLAHWPGHRDRVGDRSPVIWLEVLRWAVALTAGQATRHRRRHLPRAARRRHRPPLSPTLRPSGIHARRVSAWHDHGSERVGADPAGPAADARRHPGRPAGGLHARRAGEAAIGAQQLHDVSAALHHALESFSGDIREPGQLARAAPALRRGRCSAARHDWPGTGGALGPFPRGARARRCHVLVDAQGGRGSRTRRHERLGPDVRRRTIRDHAALPTVSFAVSDRPHVRTGAGWCHVRHARSHRTLR